VSCASGKCGFLCTGTTFNQNGQYGDGCECSDPGDVGASCPGTTVTAPAVITGRILPATDLDWFAVTFPSEAGNCGKHYSLQLVANGNPIAMTVQTSCSAPVTCGGGETSATYTTWEWTNSGGQCTQASPTTYFVKVAATGSATSCADYTIVASVL
jgi:hypothetical protein